MRTGFQGYSTWFLLLLVTLVGLMGLVVSLYGQQEYHLAEYSFQLGQLILLTSPLVVYLYATTFFFILAWRYVDPYQLARSALDDADRERPFVSMMVAVHNDEHLIVDCINSMLTQTYREREIWVVNDGSTDRTREILNDHFGKNRNVNIIHLEQNIGKKGALAQAMKKAKGSIFAFTDSDSIWEPTAIERMVAIFMHRPEVGAISGHTNARNAGLNALTSLQDGWNQKQYRMRKGFESIFGSVSCVSGPLACYRREAVFNYIPAWVDDRFLGQRFRFATDRTLTGFTLGGARLGPGLKTSHKESSFVKNEDHPCRDWQVVYCESAKAQTFVAETRAKMITQRVRWGKSFLRNLFLTGRFYYHRPFLPVLYYYLHVLHVFTWPLVITLLPIILYLLGLWQLALAYLMLLFLLLTFSGPLARMTHPQGVRLVGRPMLNLYGLLLLPFLPFYSALTIKRMEWLRDNGGSAR